MGKIKKILENELVGGTQTTDVYPVTSVKAVYDEENERLDHILNRRGVVNISTNYNDDHIAEVLTLFQAINKVPASDRVLGFQGKYLASDSWHTIIYTGDSLTSWSDTTKWVDLADKVFKSISKNATFGGIATPTTNPDTPDGPVFYIATQAGIYINFNSIEVAKGEAVILQWNGGTWIKITTELATEQEIIYDVSARNGGVGFESLSALLNSSNLSTLIPTSVRHGGMSIRFIQSSVSNSDNKYVQYRLMSNDFSTTVSDWQGVDEQPIASSDNIVKSGGVFSSISAETARATAAEKAISGTLLEKVNSLKSESFILTDLERIENVCVVKNAQLIPNNLVFSSIADLSKVDGVYKTLSVKAIETESLQIAYIFKDSDDKILLEHINSHSVNNKIVCATGTNLYIPIPENAKTFMFSYYKDDIANENGYPIFDGVKFYDHNYYGRKNFTNNTVLEKLISELYISSDFKYSLDEIFSITVCKAHKVFESRDEYHNGFFMQIGKTGEVKEFVIATKVYSTKEEAIKNISNDTYFHKDGAYAIIDLNAVNDFNSGVQYFVTMTDSVRNLEFSPAIKSKFTSPTYTTVYDIFTTKTTIPDYPNMSLANKGMYISWKPIDASVIINRVRFSNPVTLADSHNIKLITVDHNTLKIKSATALKLQNDVDFVDVSVRLEPKDLLGFSFESAVNADFIHFRKFTEEDKWVEDYVNLSSELTQQNFTEANFLFDISYEFSKTYDKVWSGLKGLFIGDSITWYEWYPNAIGQLTGCEVYNRGGNGTTVASYQDGLSFAYRSELPTDDDKNAKFSGFPSKADKVFILGGINDWGYARRNNPNFNLGNINESATKSTFAGAFKTLLSNVRKKYLNADIYVLLMYDVYTLSTSTLKHGEITLNDVDGDISSGHDVIKLEKDNVTFTLDDMRNIESKIAKMYGCKVIDLREVGFSAFVKSDRNHYFVTDDGGVNGDGLHMNKIGSVKMAKYILSQIL